MAGGKGMQYNADMEAMTPPLPLHFAVALLARVRRIPFPVLAAGVCLVFVVVGVAMLDDYGVSPGENHQRGMAIANVDYVMGDRDPLISGRRLHHDVNRYYGIGFELPVLLVERVLGLQDSRSVFLLRHLFTHLFFIIGGFFCGLLAYRMFGSRWAGVLAMLLFLLHPRLYAHSFINQKDIPFLAMFVISLYLMHRALRRDTIGAYVLLGVVVGVAVNVRPFALILLPAGLAMRGLDWRFASDSRGRRRILITGGVFAAAVLLGIYVSHPYYWENPLRFIDGFQELSQHPVLLVNLFQGQSILSDAVPPHYIPVWFGITAPPVALLLGVIGAAVVLWRGLRAPMRILRAGELRFLFLVLGCFVLPVVVAVALQSNIYNGWRQMYFLWGPFCLLAAAGCFFSLNFLGKRNSPALSGGGIGYKKLGRIMVYGVASAGVAGAVYAIVSLHPHQQVYFNLLVNRAGQDELAQQYYMNYYNAPQRQGMEYLLERYSDGPVYVLDTGATVTNYQILPAGERERIVLADAWNADFHIRADWDWSHTEPANSPAPGPVIYEWRAYGSAYMVIAAPRLVWGAGLQPGEDAYRAAYQEVTATGVPAARGTFDVYISDGSLYYVKENCALGDREMTFFLHLFPADGDDLPAGRGVYGFENRDFYFMRRGGFFDGKCITQEPLPDYPITRISTGQYIFGGERLWQAEINPSVLAQFSGIEAGLAGWQAAAKGVFDIYWDGGRVIYYKDSCVAADTEGRFFLHLFPADAGDLPGDRREYGFENVGFDFGEYGVRRDGKCLAIVPLPGYEIVGIRTGQYTPERGRLWEAEFALGGGDGGR